MDSQNKKLTRKEENDFYRAIMAYGVETKGTKKIAIQKSLLEDLLYNWIHGKITAHAECKRHLFVEYKIGFFQKK